MEKKATEIAPVLSKRSLFPLFREVWLPWCPDPTREQKGGSYLSTIPSTRHGTVS